MNIKYISTIHTPKGSYRMATYLDGWKQNDITRMFEIAEGLIPISTFDDIIHMLEIEDEKCETYGYHRYDCVNSFDNITNVDIQTIHRLMYEHIILNLGIKTFDVLYREVLIGNLNWQISEIQYGYIDRYSIMNSDMLLVQHDIDKAIAIVVVSNPNDFINIKTLDAEIRLQVSKHMHKLKILPIYLYSIVESNISHLLPTKDYFILTIDDFIMLLNQEGMNLQNLYYYWCDRINVFDKTQGKEIDVFCSYWNNKQTFYSDTDTFKPEIGRLDLYYKMKCDWEQKRDLHLIRTLWGYCMVSRFTDFHRILPIYRPASSLDQKNLICHYFDSQVIILSQSKEKDKQIVYQEIAKSLLVWMFAIEQRFVEPLLYGNIQISIEIVSECNFEMLSNDKGYIFRVPEKKLMDINLRNNIEQIILKHFLNGLSNLGVSIAPNFLYKTQIVFEECKGHILQLTNAPDILLWQDGIRISYNVNNRWSDKVLTEVAEFLDIKGKEIVLSVKDSSEVAVKIQDYLINEIYAILQEYANDKLLKRFIKLEHSSLFWLKTSHGRYIGIENLMEYIGVTFDKQKDIVNQHTRTSNITKLFIERLIKNDFIPKSKQISEEVYDRLFALGHQYYNISMYLDVLNVEGESALLTILKNGRFALPLDCLEKSQSYFLDLMNHELDGLNNHLKIATNVPDYSLDLKDDQFLKAFYAEYNMSFENYLKILNRCIVYAIQSDSIVSIPESGFKTLFFNTIDVDYNVFKKHFILHKKTAKGLKYYDFAVQRTNRLFQVSTCPWILYNGQIHYSFKIIYRHWEVLRDRIERGRLRASSDIMKIFIGKINKNRGDLFNNALYELYKQQNVPGLMVYKNVKIADGETLNTGLDNIGDIDLLLIDTIRKNILCIELKNYKESRSVFDLYEQSQKTENDLIKVIKRDKWCKENVKQFSKIYENVDKAYHVQTIFLTYNMQTIRYHSKTIYPQIKFCELRELIDKPLVLLEESST